MGGDFDTVWKSPNISKSAFHAETALVAFDSQINIATCVFIPFQHEMYKAGNLIFMTIEYWE